MKGQSEMSEVKVGQIWASTHRADIRGGVRQERHVTAVQPGYAFLLTPGRSGSNGVKTNRNGIVGYRLVRDV